MRMRTVAQTQVTSRWNTVKAMTSRTMRRGGGGREPGGYDVDDENNEGKVIGDEESTGESDGVHGHITETAERQSKGRARNRRWRREWRRRWFPWL